MLPEKWPRLWLTLLNDESQSLKIHKCLHQCVAHCWGQVHQNPGTIFFCLLLWYSRHVAGITKLDDKKDILAWTMPDFIAWSKKLWSRFDPTSTMKYFTPSFLRVFTKSILISECFKSSRWTSPADCWSFSKSNWASRHPKKQFYMRKWCWLHRIQAVFVWLLELAFMNIHHCMCSCLFSAQTNEKTGKHWCISLFSG